MELVAPTRFLNPILVFILGFTGGVFVSSLVFIPPLVSLLILIVGGAVLSAEKIWNQVVTQEVLILSLVIISFSFGSFRYAIKDFHELQIPTETGVMISEPEDKDNVRRFVLTSDNGEKVLVSAPPYTPVEYGDRVSVTGKLERPGVIEAEDGGRPFDYGQYLAKDDIYYTLSFAEVEILSSGHGHPIKSALFQIKKRFIDQARKILAEPYASLLLGLVVAGRDALPSDILEEFRKAGVIHIVVLSGFNITLIAEFMRRVFASLFLWVRWSKWPQAPALFSIVAVALFVIMTGGEATVVRAAIMALTVIVSGLFGRNYSASRALLAAGFLMLMHNPKILVFDPSFQLSFLATLGLIYVMPLLEKFLFFITPKWQLREIISQTSATQITVLPLLVYSVGDISLVSLPANILILLTVPWAMLLGFIAVILSYISAVIAWPVTFATHLLLSWILFVSQAFGSLPFATVKTPSLSFGAVFLLYLFLSGLVIWLRSKNSPRSFSS